MSFQLQAQKKKSKVKLREVNISFSHPCTIPNRCILFFFKIYLPYHKQSEYNHSLTHVTDVHKCHRHIQATLHDVSASFKDILSRRHLPLKNYKATLKSCSLLWLHIQFAYTQVALRGLWGCHQLMIKSRAIMLFIVTIYEPNHGFIQVWQNSYEIEGA